MLLGLARCVESANTARCGAGCRAPSGSPSACRVPQQSAVSPLRARKESLCARGAGEAHATRGLARLFTMLAIIIITAAVGLHSPHSRINSSQPYYLIAPGTSRSPNEYLEWGPDWCWARGRSNNMRECVQSHQLGSAGTPPITAHWFIFPEPQCNTVNMSASGQCYYHIFGAQSSNQPAMMLGFKWNGMYSQRPYYTEDENWQANQMTAHRFRIEAVSHAAEQPNADELYFIMTGPASGKPDEMLFLNRDFMGDILDTWTIDLNDDRAMWRIVPVACADRRAAGCELPDFQAAWDEYHSSMAWGVVISNVVFWSCCFCRVLLCCCSEEKRCCLCAVLFGCCSVNNHEDSQPTTSDSFQRPQKLVALPRVLRLVREPSTPEVRAYRFVRQKSRNLSWSRGRSTTTTGVSIQMDAMDQIAAQKIRGPGRMEDMIGPGPMG